jgi:7tm Odorant receptor
MELFRIQTKCLRLVGLHRTDFLRKPKLFMALYVAIVVCLVFCVAVEAFFISGNLEDVLGSSEAFGPLTTIVLAITKIFTFLAYREKFYELIDRINELATKTHGEDVTELQRVNRIDQNLALLYLAAATFVGVAQNSIPAVADFISFLQGRDVTREMPWKSDYPYDPTQTPAYEITYIIFVAATYFTILISVSKILFILFGTKMSFP